MSKPTDLSPLLPDDATLKARRAALVDAVGSNAQDPRPGRGWSGRVPQLALGGAIALAAIAIALIFSAGGDNPSAAFAVEPQEGGGVTIKVYSLEDADGLEQALEDAGIRAQVTWLPPGEFCREPHFTPSRARLPGGGALGGGTISGPGALTISVGSTRSARHRLLANVNLDPAAFRPDQSVVLSGSPKPFGGDPEGGFEARFDVAEGPVEPCKRISAPAGSIGSIAIPPGARGSGSTSAPPASGQLFYTRTKVVQLQGWDADGPGAGTRTEPRYFTANLLGPEANALPALVSSRNEVWTAPNGNTRERETLERVEFLSAGDQKRWEAAGSPPPFAFDPAEHEVEHDGSGRLVKEYASRSWRGSHEFANVTKLSRLPTDPEALRLAIEGRNGGGDPVDPSPVGSHTGAVTAERLMEILSEPLSSRELRAAAIAALAQIPGIEIEAGATDAAGRHGDAIVWIGDQGFGRRFIVDLRTAAVLAQAEVIFDASAAEYPGVPDGTVFRETAYLRSGVVESDRERPADAS